MMLWIVKQYKAYHKVILKVLIVEDSEGQQLKLAAKRLSRSWESATQISL